MAPDGSVRHSAPALIAAVLFLPLTARGEGDALRFDHRAHVEKHKIGACETCHTSGANADTVRPAMRDHKTCDTAGCHADEFYGKKAATTKLCSLCHAGPAMLGGAAAKKLQPFPRRMNISQTEDSFLDARDFYAEFSHKKHLRTGGPIKERTDQGCLFCHKIESAAVEARRPGHEACASCHDEKHAAPMSRCDACHQYRKDGNGIPVSTGPSMRDRPARVGGRFKHETHRVDRRKAEPTPVSCGVCHSRALEADKLSEIVMTDGRQMMVSACGSCHRSGQANARGKPLFTITGQCTLCHSAGFMENMSAPAWHR
jgi:hypothetical protein